MPRQADIEDAMHTWLRECANPTLLQIYPAVAAGYLMPSEGPYTYVCTELGRAWLVVNAMDNGADYHEAVKSIDYLDGAA